MAKPDWGSLQTEFLAEHAISNISPKDWCEARGINYATARRYIKKTAQTKEQRTAQKKKRIVQAVMRAESAEELIEDDSLTPMQATFVIEYLKDKNASMAALRAGYSDGSTGRQLIAKDHIAQAIKRQLRAAAERALITTDQIIARMWGIATLDVNELVEYRRQCCRHCWGKNHLYQWTEEEYNAARSRAEERDDEDMPDIAGGFGFRKHRVAHPECPECNGEGYGDVHIHDTRKLSLAARMAYDGVKVTKDGVQLLITDRSKMLDNVAKHLGVFDSLHSRKLEELEVARREMENQRMRDEDSEDGQPTPVQININVVDARADDGDQPDA
ncbi:terminase small subunit [bacteria symbiont BFo1 of Frankliniella occidentalis]|nr:terminase small subunit [bacteria symbiont BFo1 of Frankliniella occidentalis]KYP85844.1 terminase small subunit [bacteria symbiont BFo1 of Frankliniella occidentalis]